MGTQTKRELQYLPRRIAETTGWPKAAWVLGSRDNTRVGPHQVLWGTEEGRAVKFLPHVENELGSRLSPAPPGQHTALPTPHPGLSGVRLGAESPRSRQMLRSRTG